MKKLLFLIILSSVFSMGFDWNKQEKQDEEIMKYNSFENKWSYEKKDSTLQYNPFEKNWEYREKGDTLKYNPFENKWE